MYFRENMNFTPTTLYDGRVILRREYAGLRSFSGGPSSLAAGGPSESLRDPNSVSYRRPEPGDAFKRITKIQLGGSNSYKFTCSGINFIFVQGKKSACVATCDMDKAQDRTKTLEYLLSCYSSLADRKLYTARMYKQPVELEPCAGVCVLFDSDEKEGSTSSSGHKVSGEEAAISLLKKELESRSTDSLIGTVQVAISALQRFYYMKKLEPDEIEVCVSGVDGSSSLLTKDEIAGYLAQL